MATIRCPKCGSKSFTQLENGQYACPYCGEKFTVKEQAPTPQPVYNAPLPNQDEPHPNVQNAPQSFFSQQQQFVQQQSSVPGNNKKGKKDKATAAILAIFLGSFGAQDFYLGNYIWGIVALFFCWTYIPMIWGIIDGIKLLCMSNEDFQEKYNK